MRARLTFPECRWLSFFAFGKSKQSVLFITNGERLCEVAPLKITCRIEGRVAAQHPIQRVLPSVDRPSPSWWVPVLLALPALIPLVNSIVIARSTGQLATGFIQIDQPYYFASAREYFDQGFHLLYGNPYAGYDTPRIYFQPHLFLLGCVQRLIGLDPGITWNIFSVIGALFAAFVAVRFYREVVGWRTPAEKIGLLCFFWGGGILTLVGVVYGLFVRRLNAVTILHFDTGTGWWMLNFGRNLVYGPTEAYYHGVFLFCMLCLYLRRFGVAIALAALLSLSHPWTGIEASLVVMVYLLVERLFRDKSVKPIHVAGAVAVFSFHVGYYMVFLNRFADHRVLQSQWKVQGATWLYRPSTFLPALFMVGLLALIRLWRWPGFLQVIQDSRNRLFLVWFLVIFGLTQHYWVIQQSSQSTSRTADWIPLFFWGRLYC